ncbi:lipopolysaccharide biosynthesis protein [Flavobacterium magnum]|nr:oligosaccharide flippase family protein [Flavobacterium magnum]
MIKEKLLSVLYKKKTKDFLVYGIGQVVNILTPLLITPYLLHICGFEKLGIIAMGQAFAYILIVVVDYSSYIVGVRETSINRGNHAILQHLFKTTYAAKFLLLFLVCLVTVLLTLFVPYFRENMTVFYLSVSIIVGQVINPTWFLQGLENFLWITIINIISKVINVIGVILFVTSDTDYIYANLWLGGSAMAANLMGFLWLVRKYNISFRNISKDAIADLLKKDFSFCVSQLFFSIRNYSSVMIIGFFAGNYVAGQFKVIEQIINLFRTYLQMFFKFSYSYICFEIDRNLTRGIQLWKKFNGLNTIFLISLLAAVFVCADFVLRFFKVENALLPEFITYLHVALFVPLLIGITLPMEQLLFSLNKNRYYIRITILSTCLNALGIALSMTFFGLREAFFVLIITELSLTCIYLLILKPYFAASNSTR